MQLVPPRAREKPMSISTCRVDAEGRIVLPPVFIGKTVTLAVVNESEVRVRLAATPRRRPSLEALLARVTDENLPERVDFGPAVGGEQL
jgi:antitoxin component of MazEF toxin-antitoxin module